MFSAYQAGVPAGVAARLRGEYGSLHTLSVACLERRRRAGIAHTEPEEEFLLGFGDGFTGRVAARPDGLCKAEDDWLLRSRE